MSERGVTRYYPRNNNDMFRSRQRSYDDMLYPDRYGYGDRYALDREGSYYDDLQFSTMQDQYYRHSLDGMSRYRGGYGYDNMPGEYGYGYYGRRRPTARYPIDDYGRRIRPGSVIEDNWGVTRTIVPPSRSIFGFSNWARDRSRYGY